MVPPTPKRMVWRVTEAPWRMLQRCFVLFFCGVQLVLRPGVLTIQAKRVGLARTIYLYGLYMIFLAGKSPNIRSYTV